MIVALALVVLAPATAAAATTDVLGADTSAVVNCAPMPDAYAGSDDVAAELRELRREQITTCRYTLAALGRPALSDGPQPDAPLGTVTAASGATLDSVYARLHDVQIDTASPLIVALTRGQDSATPLHTTSPAVGDSAASATYVRLTDDDETLASVYNGLRYVIWFGCGLLLLNAVVPLLVRVFRA